MSYTFTCPHCHLKTLVEDQYAGKSGPCAGCGKEVVIPAFRAQTPSENSVGEQRINLMTQALYGRRGRFLLSALSPRHRALAIRIGLALIAMPIIAAILLTWLAPTLKYATANRNRGLCLGNMRQIANALEAYAVKYGSYPPPVVYDPAGTPLYSWRVLILPQLGYPELYAQFNRSQPWDSATNILVSRNMPAVYGSPASPDAVGLQESNYALLTGPGTLFPPSGPLAPKDVRDSESQTILVVETSNGGLNWCAPGDIDTTKGIRQGTKPYVEIGGNHQDGAGVVTVDGTAMVLPPDIAPEMVQALVTPSGGEAMNTRDLQR